MTLRRRLLATLVIVIPVLLVVGLQHSIILKQEALITALLAEPPAAVHLCKIDPNCHEVSWLDDHDKWQHWVKPPNPFDNPLGFHVVGTTPPAARQ